MSTPDRMTMRPAKLPRSGVSIFTAQRQASILAAAGWLALGGSTVQAAVVAAVEAAPPAGPTPHDLPLVLAGLGLLALLLALLVAVLAGVTALRLARQRAGLAKQLHDARVRSSALSELLDVWHWRSDQAHRLIWLRPPCGAPQQDWAATPPAELLWLRFIATDPAALRARLDAGAPLPGIATRQPQGGDAAPLGSLQAVAINDRDGHFMGYEGVWREAAPTPLNNPSSDAVQDEHAAFSYTVSHDLRAPIRVVEGFTKIIKEDYGRLLDRTGNDHLERVLGAAARMNSMIDALLALSQLSTQPLADQPVNLSQLAGFVADDLRRQWPEREVRLHIEPGLQVQGDPTLLRLVLENLLGNAWKYTGKCGEPAVWFERAPAGVATPASTFCVRDNGAGFDMRFADRLFGVFQRLHSANDFPGTGVGLASVRRIVRRHGGEVWAQAEVDCGAAFYFSLARR